MSLSKTRASLLAQIFFSLVGLFFTGLFVTFTAVFFAPVWDTSPGVHHDHWYGTVTKVSGCDAGRHTLYCWVYVEGREKPYRLEITDFPGDHVVVGDRVGYYHVDHKYYREAGLRKNDFLIIDGHCLLYFCGDNP